MISAAEASSDLHGAELLRALKATAPSGEAVGVFGIGGPKLQAEGLFAVVDARELLSMGFFEIFWKLPRIFEALRRVSRAAALEKPDAAILIDYPDFHFRLARRLKAQGVPVVCYIPPKVWVWRRKRVERLRDLFARVLCIFPFEESFYGQEQVPAKYVGNPLMDELPLSLTQPQARQELGLGERDKVLVLMPGSRPSELMFHVDLMLESARAAALRMRESGSLGPEERLKVLIPFPLTVDRKASRIGVDRWLGEHAGEADRFILDVRVSRGDAASCLKAADAGLIKSGTSTLEAAVLGLPHAVVYRTQWFTEFVFKNLIRYRGPVGLVNLVGAYAPGESYRASVELPRDRYLASEFICDRATVEQLSAEVVSLFCDSDKREKMKQRLALLRQNLESEKSPSRAAADEVWKLVGELRVR